MKKTILVSVLSVCMLGPAYADNIERFCGALGDSTKLMQETRNAELPPTILLRKLKESVVTPSVRDLLLEILTVIYDNPPHDPNLSGEIAYNACIGQFGHLS